MSSLQLHPPLLLVFLATIIGTSTVLYGIYYIRRYGRTQQVTTFTVFAASVTVWTFFATIQLAGTDRSTTMLGYKLLHFGSFTSSPALLFYALSMGDAREWVNRRTVSAVALLLVPAFVLLFLEPVPHLLVNPELVSIGAFSVIEHGNSLLYVSYLTWFYVMATAGLSYIVYRTWIDPSIGRLQTAILVPAIFAPMLLSVFQTFGLPGFDLPGTILTPISFSAGLAGISVAAFRYGTFDTKSLARSRTIERMQEGYLLADTDNTVIDANSAATDLLGDSSLVGKPVADVLPGYRTQMPPDGDTTTMFEADVGRPNDERTVEVSASRLVSNGQVVGTLCVFRDITVRTQTQERLQRQRDDLELLNQVVRHDIRNDLQVVLTLAELLDHDGHVDTDGQSTLDTLQESAENAVDLTKTARELTRVMIESDTNLRQLDLPTVIEPEIAEVRDSFEAAVVEVKGPLPDAQIEATEMVDSVFRNVLKNAVQHNDTETPRVTVSATTSGDFVEVRIADNGPGVPDDQKEEIFGRGEKGLESEGTGLGLYLADTLVSRSGGEMWVEDRDPRGAVFAIDLPVADESTDS